MTSLLQHFSENVAEAHGKFQEAAERAGARFVACAHPLAGPGGETPHMAFARLGTPQARKVQLILSGVHGVEGFCGAAIQSALLSSHADQTLAEDHALVLVHLVNPWGAAWDRREDHQNIDVFRNLLYADAPCAPHPLFDDMDDMMDLANLKARSVDENEALHTALLNRFGQQTVIKAIRQGQHHRPKSFTYHGREPCWSNVTLKETLPELLAGAEQIAVIDIHTGFGGYGDALVMSYDAPDDPRHVRVRKWFSDQIYTPGQDADIPAHRAISPYAFVKELAPGADLTALILEFGTRAPETSRDIFLDNHIYHMFGDPTSAEGQKARLRYRDYLYPEEQDWKEKTLKTGLEVCRTTYSGLSAWAKNAS